MGADGAASASALAIAFAGRETLGAIAESARRRRDVLDRARSRRRWSAGRCARTGELDFELTFEALTPPVTYGGRQAIVKAGGMEGYEQLCRVSGTVNGAPMTGVGQRGHSWGNPDWDKIALTRTVGAWFDGRHRRHARPRAHHEGRQPRRRGARGAPRSRRERRARDRRGAALDDDRRRRTGRSAPASSSGSTKDDEYPHRGAGEVVTGSTLELGALRMDVAFFRWHIEGRTGFGRYDVIRRAA